MTILFTPTCFFCLFILLSNTTVVNGMERQQQLKPLGDKATVLELEQHLAAANATIRELQGQLTAANATIRELQGQPGQPGQLAAAQASNNMKLALGLTFSHISDLSNTVVGSLSAVSRAMNEASKIEFGMRADRMYERLMELMESLDVSEKEKLFVEEVKQSSSQRLSHLRRNAEISISSSQRLSHLRSIRKLLERKALTALYDSTNGDRTWKNKTNWKTDKDICEWHGVTCTDESVTVLNLHYNKLSGEIPKEIGYLTSLKELNLQMNKLSGPIPTEIGQLINLKELYLSNNQLSGPIPTEIGQLTNLKELWLTYNKLSGPIPKEIGQLTNLKNYKIMG